MAAMLLELHAGGQGGCRRSPLRWTSPVASAMSSRHGRTGRQGPRRDEPGDNGFQRRASRHHRCAALAATGYRAAPPPSWADLDVDPADLVVIVGGAELGPYGSSRTRFEMEVPVSCRQPACWSWPGRLVWSNGKTIPNPAGTTPPAVTWSMRPNWSSTTTILLSNVAA